MSKNKQTIDDKMQRLQELAEWFEAASAPQLEEAQQRYEEASLLAQEIQDELAAMQQRVTIHAAKVPTNETAVPTEEEEGR
jgi:hypothetical protein